ncbi:MAG TPA: NAD(P)-binding domain-containing protein [Candidatus Limnocylindria bacterium]|nr:NAD(P)-binding domain-containing protein [Candidatus Limnocylindria bacterium]
MAKRVAVIGAGAAGLASARWLADAGLEPVVLERTGAVGGLWRPDTGLAYPSLRTNTSKQKTAFSDLQFDAALPDHPFRDDVLAYLERYADVTGVRARIRFGQVVASVHPAAGGWTVDGEPFDAVVVATGLFARPVEPALDGRDRFRGMVLHSRDYRDPAPFAGKRVVVAGAGSSGADIAVELAAVARSVSVAVRELPTFLPRHHRGRPYDHRATRLARMLPSRVRRWRARRLLADEYRRRGMRLERVSLNTTPGADLLDELARGRIAMRAALAGLDADGAIFADGSRVDADAVVLATGYRAEFPFLPAGVPQTIAGALALYRLVFPPGVAGLAFVGMTRVSGPVFPVVELQARWAAAVFAGRVALPEPEAMRREIERRIAIARSIGDDQMRVELLPYLDDIARRIGATPSLWRHPGLLVSPVSARDYRPKLREP